MLGIVAGNAAASPNIYPGGGGCGTTLTWRGTKPVKNVDFYDKNRADLYGVWTDSYSAMCLPFNGNLGSTVYSPQNWWFSLMNYGYYYEQIVCVSYYNNNGGLIWSGSQWGAIGGLGGPPYSADPCTTDPSLAPGASSGNGWNAGSTYQVETFDWLNIPTNNGYVTFTEVSWYQTPIVGACCGAYDAAGQVSTLTISVPYL